MQQLTIEIPETLAQRLAWLAAAQQKSVEQIALERLAPLLEIAPTQPSGSPAAIRQAMREPHLRREAVDELEQAIAEGKLPVQQEGVFDEKESRDFPLPLVRKRLCRKMPTHIDYYSCHRCCA